MNNAKLNHQKDAIQKKTQQNFNYNNNNQSIFEFIAPN